MPTVDDIHDAVTHIGTVYNRYYAMLTNATSSRIGLPTRQLFEPIPLGAELAGGRGATLRLAQ